MSAPQDGPGPRGGNREDRITNNVNWDLTDTVLSAARRWLDDRDTTAIMLAVPDGQDRARALQSTWPRHKLARRQS